MSVIINLPPVLSQRTGGQQLEVDASSLIGIINQLEKEFPGFKYDLLTNEDNIRHSFIIFVNGNQIQNKEDLAKNINDGSTIEIVRLIAGG